MSLNDLISTEGILPTLRAPSKKALLQEMCERAAAVSHLPAKDLLEAVMQRERLGSTGVGRGIAIPHGKLGKCERIFGVFARLERPIEFDALDGEPVDLAFLLIAPESAGADHLKALASIARMLRDAALTSQLRFARDPATMLSIMASGAAAPQAPHAA